MKKYFLLFTAIVLVITFNGCDLNSIPFNVPISVDVALGPTNSTSVSDQGTVNLADYEELTSDVEKVSYVEAAFRVKTVSNPNLRGNITITLTNPSGFLFTLTLNNVLAADYITNPYVLPMTGEQVQQLNAYLGTISDQTFTGSVSVTNISGGAAPYSLTAVIDFVLEADTQL